MAGPATAGVAWPARQPPAAAEPLRGAVPRKAPAGLRISLEASPARLPAWQDRAWQEGRHAPRSGRPPQRSAAPQPRAGVRESLNPSLCDGSSPCKRARVLRAKAPRGDVRGIASVEPTAPFAGVAGPTEGPKTLPASGPSADHAARLLQQMLAALTPGEPHPGAERPRPAGWGPHAGSAGSCGAARRSAALERLARARCPMRSKPSSTGSGSGRDSPPGPQHSSTERTMGLGGVHARGGCGHAHAHRVRGSAEDASLLLFAEGCVPARRSCTVSLHAQGLTGPWAEPAPWVAAAGAAPGRALHSERALSELQAGLQRAASPATAAFLDVRDLGLDPDPAAGYGEPSGEADQAALQASWRVQGAQGRFAGASGAAAEPAAAGSREQHAAMAEAAHEQRRPAACAGCRPPQSGEQRAGGSVEGPDRVPQQLQRRVRARVHPSTRPGASWGSINAAHIAPVHPRRPSPSNPRVSRPAWQVPGTAPGGAEPSAPRQRPSGAQAACGAAAGGALDGGAGGADSEGLERVRVEPAPADVAGLLEALRGVEALALAVRADTHASRQVQHTGMALPMQRMGFIDMPLMSSAMIRRILNCADAAFLQAQSAIVPRAKFDTC